MTSVMIASSHILSRKLMPKVWSQWCHWFNCVSWVDTKKIWYLTIPYFTIFLLVKIWATPFSIIFKILWYNIIGVIQASPSLIFYQSKMIAPQSFWGFAHHNFLFSGFALILYIKHILLVKILASPFFIICFLLLIVIRMFAFLGFALVTHVQLLQINESHFTLNF